MTVRARLAALLVRHALLDRHGQPPVVSRLAMRCWPTDCDINRHMNNSRYVALMDVGRYHLVLASGLWQAFWRRKWFPVAVRVEIDFKRPINPGERFVLETRWIEAGTKSLKMSQRFWVGDQLAAHGVVTVVFLHKGKSQELAPVVAEWGHLLRPLEELPKP